MQGESCMMFNKECPFMQVCTLDPSKLAPHLPPNTVLDSTEYQIKLKFDDLIDAQLSKEKENA
jgi:hypothetical protein